MGLWEKMQGSLKQEIGAVYYDQWVRPLELIKEGDGEIELGTFNINISKFISEHYVPLFKAVAKKEYKKIINFRINAESKDMYGDVFVKTGQEDIDISICPNFNFDNFIVAHKNQKFISCLKKVCLVKEVVCVPIIIAAKSGLGKTHLLHAIANEIKANMPRANITFLSFETYIDNFDNLNMPVDKKGRNILLLDNMDNFCRMHLFEKDNLAEHKKFFATFDRVFIASTASKDNLADQLNKHFHDFKLYEIFKLDFNSRLKFLRQRFDRHGLLVKDSDVEFLARMLDKDLSYLESTVLRLKAISSLSKKAVDKDLIRRVVRF
ncbi:MAG: DnaA/Hda family protein [Pseudomonadota bacterium]